MSSKETKAGEEGILPEADIFGQESPNDKPSAATAYSRHLLIREFLMGNPAVQLFVLFERKKCPLSIQPCTGEVRFCAEGQNYYLVRFHYEVVLTQGSLNMLLAYEKQKELEKTESEGV